MQEADLTGSAFCRAYSDLVDAWLRRLLGDERGVALVAVGGYGRRRLCPGSDLDVLLLHERRRDVKELADRIWYPVWDAGIELDHSVRTPKEVLAVVGDDLKTGLGLLDGRVVAGDADLGARVLERARRRWTESAPRWIEELAEVVDERHERFGEAAFLLEPDLKESKGGLRDVDVLRAARAAVSPPGVSVDATTSTDPNDSENVARAAEELLTIRVELHRESGRSSNVLLLQEQDAVAPAVGAADADELMSRVANAARTIAWTSDEQWRHLRRLVARSRRGRTTTIPDDVALEPSDDLSDPATVMRVAARAAAAGAAIDPKTLDRLRDRAAIPAAPWPPDALAAFVDLLSCGHAAIPVLEALDQSGLLVRYMPEWEPVRCRPQRNAYHRFTVDRHLWETAANAADLTHQVRRPDLLLVGALLHDLGKGYPGDHTETGMAIVRIVAERMGFGAPDAAVLVAMVEHHLLLPDVATRRDLDDPSTIEATAAAVGTLNLLELLGALTEADSLATGSSAWGTWKKGLVKDLVARTAALLGGTHAISTPSLPTPAHRQLMAKGDVVVERSGDEVTVVAPDRPGLLSRIAGVLALHALDVRAAVIVSEDGMGLEVFSIESESGVEPDWDAVAEDMRRAVHGRLALEARLSARARAYAARRRPAAAQPARHTVTFDNEASSSATVIEVRAADEIGVLYRITRALADCDLDVRTAKVSTLGHEVVDAFYVRDADGGKISDDGYIAEIERAVLDALDRFG